MPAHGLYGNMCRVRYDPELELFKMKCYDCEKLNEGQTYWPLTLEFWNPKSMQRCLACNAAKKARTRRAQGAEHRKKRAAQQRAYHHDPDNKALLNAKHVEYMREYRARNKGEA